LTSIAMVYGIIEARKEEENAIHLKRIIQKKL